MGKTDKLSPEVIENVRLEIRKVIAENSAWQNAVDDIVEAARPRNPEAEGRARRAAITIVVSENTALAAAAEKIFKDAAAA